MKLPLDYPRINQFPEWFTIDPQEEVSVEMCGARRKYVGKDLLEGLPVKLEPGEQLRLTVTKLGTPPQE